MKDETPLPGRLSVKVVPTQPNPLFGLKVSVGAIIFPVAEEVAKTLDDEPIAEQNTVYGPVQVIYIEPSVNEDPITPRL